jgi:DNA-binding Lrp family transcriptional regulator
MMQAHIWRYLKDVGPQSPRAVAAHFGITTGSASHRLTRMMARGFVLGTGTTLDRKYTARGRRPPRDRRGRHAAALVNLAKGRERGLPHFLARWGRLHVPKPADALDAAMRGWRPE